MNKNSVLFFQDTDTGQLVQVPFHAVEVFITNVVKTRASLYTRNHTFHVRDKEKIEQLMSQIGSQGGSYGSRDT